MAKKKATKKTIKKRVDASEPEIEEQADLPEKGRRFKVNVSFEADGTKYDDEVHESELSVEQINYLLDKKTIEEI